MSRQKKDWEVYERMIARLITDHIDTDLCVTVNARVNGRISGRRRQIDILIERRHDTDNSQRIVVDAKRKARKITVNDVEAFLGVLDDTGATHGFLVCPAGYTKAAEKRAQLSLSLCLVPLNQIPNFDPLSWPKCRGKKCKDGRVFWDGYPAIDVTAVPLSDMEKNGKVLTFVHKVGKCDRCGRFHVLCATCNVMLSLPEDDPDDIGQTCNCKMRWFWIASVEQDENGEKSAELHLVTGLGEVVTADRRPCR